MKIAQLIFLIVFCVCVSHFSQAQNPYLSFVEDEQKEFFRKNGWELFYANEDVAFYDYVIYNNELIIAEADDYDYKIHFLNDSRLIEESKIIKGSPKHVAFLPKLYVDEEQIAFAPMQKFECKVVPHAEKVKKRGRFKNFFKRRKGEVFRKYHHYQGHLVYSFASLNRRSGYQSVEIQLGKNKKTLSTLYVAKSKSRTLTYTDNEDRIEIEFLDDKIFLVDNFNKKFLVFGLDHNKLFEADLSQFTTQESSSFGGSLLRKDPVSDNIYLVRNKGVFKIVATGDEFQFDKIELSEDFRFYKTRFYGNYLYNFFSTAEKSGWSIYRKKLN